MVTCRYVGGDEFEVGDREFARVGEVAVFSEAIFRDAVNGGCPLLPEADFQRLGFTQGELDQYGSLEDRDECTEVFAEKLARAQSLFRELQRLMRYKESADLVVAEASHNFVSDHRDAADPGGALI